MTLSLDILPYRVPLAAPIRTSKAAMSERQGWRLRLSCSETQRVGWGEVACWPGFGSGGARTAESLRALQANPDCLRALEAIGLAEPDQACRLEAIQEAAAITSALEARHGLELAALDLRARSLKLPLASLLTRAPLVPKSAPTHALISSLEDAQRAVALGFHALKLKVGAREHWSEDGLLIAALSAYLDGLEREVTLRLDANQAWSENDAIGALVTAHAYGVEWLEEPLQRALSEAQGWPAWRRLQQRTGVSLAADESLQQAPFGEALSVSLIEQRLRGALEEGVELITLKPMFVGGLLTCASLAREALNRGARVCLTHALEGAIGRRGVAHLCAALSAEGLRVEGGLTGALSMDVMPPLEVHEGRVLIQAEPGLGELTGATS